jgi:hypothetical protein
LNATHAVYCGHGYQFAICDPQAGCAAVRGKPEPVARRYLNRPRLHLGLYQINYIIAALFDR